MNLLDTIKTHLEDRGYKLNRLAPGYSYFVITRGALFIACIELISHTEIRFENTKGKDKVFIDFHDPTSFQKLDQCLGGAMEEVDGILLKG